MVPEPQAVEPVAEVVPEPAAVETQPETKTPGPVVTKARHLTAKQKKAEAAKITLAQAILAGTTAEPAPASQTSVEPEPVEPPSAPEVVVVGVATLSPEELDAEIVFSLQHCGAPSFLKSPWSSGQPLELRTRTLWDLWGQYFSAVLAASETVRDVEHCAEPAPRSQASLKNQLVALKSSEDLSQFGTELAAVFWNEANEEFTHTKFLSALAPEALCTPLGAQQIQQWLSALKQWVEASADFWGATEQLFEDPDSEGNLEGVIVYGEQYLELVEHPLALNFPQAWAEAAPISPQLETPSETETPKPELVAVAESPVPEPPPAPALNLDWDLVETAPPHILEQLGKLSSGELTREQALRQSYYFLVQYYAGVLACAGVQLRDLDVGVIEAFTHESSIEARREMLEQLLPDSLASESDVFKELAQVWNATDDGQSIQLCSTENFLKASCSEELPVEWQGACAQWLRNSNHFWQHCEHHCEDSDDQRQDIVVQFKGDFFELVHPDYSLELAPKIGHVPESEIAEAVAAIVSQSAPKPATAPPAITADIVAQAAPVSQSELLLGGIGVAAPPEETLLGGVDAGADSLFVGAASPSDLLLDGPPSLEGIPAAESDSLFGAQAGSSTDIDSLFQVEAETDWIEKLNQPTPVVEAPPVVKAKPTAPDPLAELFAVQSEPEAAKPAEVEEPKAKVRPAPKEDPMAVVDSTPKVSQSTSVVTDLLDSIMSESEAKKAKAKESSDRVAQEKAEKEKVEVAAKAEIAAIEAGVTLPTGVPTLEVVIQYEEKKQGVHTGTLILKNIGGGVLKGTLKSLHPSVRLRPTVFRENDTVVEFTIDDSDKPSNLKKNALAVNLQGGAKQELNFDRLLPAAGLAQIRTKVFDLVKQLGKSKKPKA